MATYIKFGENEVDYDQLMLNAANEVYNFVKRLPWSNKRKESFMRAYSDIASRGITSAGIGENGLWNINYNGEDLSAESEMDKQMQGAAADFFINQMRSLPTKASLEEDATKKKEDLPIFNNSYFTQQFHGKIGTDLFGGLDWTQSEWNDFDKRGENGLRGTTERAKRLANTLENYSASLKEGEHNFEGSPFTDLNDFKTRVNNVVSVLRNGTPDQYKDALYSIGLRYDDYFNDGSGDIRGTLDDGTQVTYGLYNEYLAKLQKLELEQKLKQQLEAQQARQKWILENKLYFHRSDPHIMGLDLRSLGAKYGNTQALISKLNEYSQKGLESLNPDEMSELVGAFRYGTRLPINNDLYNLIRQSSVAFKNSRITDFEALPGVEGAVWHKPTGTVLSFKNNAQRTAVDTDFLKGYSKEEQQALKRASAGNRKMFEALTNPNNPRYLDSDGSINWTNVIRDGGVDSLRILAIMSDLTAAVAALVPGYGTAISGAASVTGLVQELIADAMDDSVSWGDLGKNAGMNALFAALGLIPGGKFLKSGKWAKTLTNMALPITGIIISGGAFKSLMSDPSVKKTWDKVSDGSLTDLSVDDTKNILKVLGAAAGILQGGRGVRNAYKFHNAQPSISNSKQTIKGQSGKEYEITPELVREMDRIGNSTKRGGNEKANEYFNEHIVRPKNGEAPDKLTFEYLPTNRPMAWIREKMPSWARSTPQAKTTTVRTTTPGSSLGRRQYIDLQMRAGNYNDVNLPFFARLAARFPKVIRENVPTDFNLYFGRIGGTRLDQSSNTKTTSNSKKEQLYLPAQSSNTKTTSNSKKEQLYLPAQSSNINQRLTALNTTKIGQRPSEGFSTRLNQQEVNNMIDSFGINRQRESDSSFKVTSKRPNSSTKGGYNPNRPLENGVYSLNTNGTQITFDKQNGKVIVTFNNTKKEFKNLVSARLYLAKLLYLISKNDISKTAEILRGLKAKGIFKQGGIINNNKIKQYRNFINK